jgi:hypothetical protein
VTVDPVLDAPSAGPRDVDVGLDVGSNAGRFTSTVAVVVGALPRAEVAVVAPFDSDAEGVAVAAGEAALHIAAIIATVPAPDAATAATRDRSAGSRRRLSSPDSAAALPASLLARRAARRSSISSLITHLVLGGVAQRMRRA